MGPEIEELNPVKVFKWIVMSYLASANQYYTGIWIATGLTVFSICLDYANKMVLKLLDK